MNILSALSARLSGTSANPVDRLAELRAKLVETENRLADAESALFEARYAVDTATADFAADAGAGATLDAAVAKVSADERKVDALRQAVAALENNIAEAELAASDYEEKMRKQAEIDRLKASRKQLLADVAKAARLVEDLNALLKALAADLPETVGLTRGYALAVMGDKEPVLAGAALEAHAVSEVDALIKGTTLRAIRQDESHRAAIEYQREEKAARDAVHAERRAEDERYPHGRSMAIDGGSRSAFHDLALAARSL